MHDEQTEIFLWFDICVINEHWPEQFSKGFSDIFMEAVGDIGHTLLVLTPWDQAMMLLMILVLLLVLVLLLTFSFQPIVPSRSWCLWEMYCKEQKECDLKVCLPNEQRQAFLDTAAPKPTAVQDACGQIESSIASAGSDADRDKIAAAIEDGVGFKKLPRATTRPCSRSRASWRRLGRCTWR